jgi:hypothetical protein
MVRSTAGRNEQLRDRICCRGNSTTQLKRDNYEISTENASLIRKENDGKTECFDKKKNEWKSPGGERERERESKRKCKRVGGTLCIVQ